METAARLLGRVEEIPGRLAEHLARKGIALYRAGDSPRAAEVFAEARTSLSASGVRAPRLELEIGGENPARVSAFDCELSARVDLLSTWREKKLEQPAISNDYLDTLLAVGDAGYLREYVDDQFGRRHWTKPDDLDTDDYDRWMAHHFPRHEPETRLTGSWNYARNVERN